MPKILICNNILEELRKHIIMERILWKSVRNELSCVAFISDCNGVFPSKRNIHNEISSGHPVHLSRFQFMPFFNIAVECSLGMASNSQSVITIMRRFHWVFVFIYNFAKLTLFPSRSKYTLSAAIFHRLPNVR